MQVPIELLIHNFSYICSGLISSVLGLFILLKDRHKKTYQLYFLIAFTYALYCLFYLLAVNITDPQLSSTFAFLMTIAATAPCLNAHFAFAAFNLEKKQRNGLIAMYAGLAAMYAFFLADPSRVRLMSAPREFFPNFFTPGPYYWLYTAYFFLVIIYFFAVLINHYRKVDLNEQNRLKYFFLGFGFAYTCSLPIYMFIFGVQNAGHLMLLTPLMGLYTIPLAYGVFRYDLLNINIAIKNAALYAFFIIFVGGSIIAVNLLNNYFGTLYADFPIWILPMTSGLLVFLVSFIIWNQLRQADLLKYEFINNISHKFRTPLTHIRWLAEEFRDLDDPAARNRAVDQIQFASMRLFELTSVVIDASKNTNDLLLYRFEEVNLHDLIREIDKAHKDEIATKKLHIQFEIDPSITTIRADKTRLQFALQVLFENSLIYTPENGTIRVSMSRVGPEAVISFKDNGIGIKEEDLPHVFSKFFRAVNARHTDTEGMGIGLYIAKDIVEKHKGRIWAESEGENMGSTFNVGLPL